MLARAIAAMTPLAEVAASGDDCLLAVLDLGPSEAAARACEPGATIQLQVSCRTPLVRLASQGPSLTPITRPPPCCSRPAHAMERKRVHTRPQLARRFRRSDATRNGANW